MVEGGSDKVTRRTKVLYGVADIGLAVLQACAIVSERGYDRV
jgi:hypothetical protein